MENARDDDEGTKVTIIETLQKKTSDVYVQMQTKYEQSEQAQALHKRVKEVALDAKAKGTDIAKVAYSKGKVYGATAKTKYESIPEQRRKLYIRILITVILMMASIHMFANHLTRHREQLKLLDELDGIDHEASKFARENQQPLLRKAGKKP